MVQLNLWLFSCLMSSIAPTLIHSFTASSSTFLKTPLHSRSNVKGLAMSTETAESTPLQQETQINGSSSTTSSRVLGSQELLMLPRQYSLSDSTFPPMSHVSTAILSSTPSKLDLQNAIVNALQCHPLLRTKIQGDGEPTQRIDLFQMVRDGEPNPETFVSNTMSTNEINLDLVENQDILKVTTVADAQELESKWKKTFRHLLDHGPYSKDLLWSIHFHKIGTSDSASDSECALTLVFNHAISDQSSANLLFDHLITFMENDSQIPPAKIVDVIPPSLEESILGKDQVFQKARFDGGVVSPGVIKYVAGKAAEGFKSPVILPDDFSSSTSGADQALNAVTTITGRAAGGKTNDDTVTTTLEDGIEPAPEAGGRYSTTQFRTLSAEDTTKLLNACRPKGVTISNALTAAAAITASNFIEGENVDKTTSKSDKERNYKVLQSLDMRRFHDKDTCATPSCHAGSMDLMLGPIVDRSNSDPFWSLAVESNKQTKNFVESNGPEHAVRVFDFAMQIADMNNLVHLTAVSEASQGRAYSAGVTNAGVYEKQKGVEREGSNERASLKSKEGKYQINNLYFATSHARSGCLYQVSSLTINGEMQFTFHPAAPIVSPKVNEAFADSFIALLQEATSPAVVSKEVYSMTKPPIGTVLGLTAVLGSIAIHAGGWIDFIQNVNTMKANASPEDFSAALNFWIFFAVGHPILQPILWISDVLHGSPGPLVGGLVPLSFLLGNVVVLGAMAVSKEVGNFYFITLFILLVVLALITCFIYVMFLYISSFEQLPMYWHYLHS